MIDRVSTQSSLNIFRYQRNRGHREADVRDLRWPNKADPAFKVLRHACYAGSNGGTFMRIGLALSVAITAFFGSAATAQDAFTGPHIGAAITAVDHHFVLEETAFPSGETRRFNVNRWGPGGQVFAGYDLAVSSHVILGVEGAFAFGGRTAIERNEFYVSGIKPRYGFSATARAGFVATPRLMLYVGGGYGGHNYRVIDSDPTPGQDDLSRTRSFVLRGGSEYRLTEHVGIRAEFEHLDGTRNSFMLGVPIGF